MSIGIIYWSQTGNTKAMAEAIANGLKSEGAEFDMKEVDETNAADALKFDKLLLGCPSMGSEVLEEASFEPFYEELEKSIGGKKVGLFGSYGWGDGEWMRNWVERAENQGAQVFNGEGLIINETPDAGGIQKCEEFGKGFAKF